MDDSHRGVVGASIVVGFLLVLFCTQGAWQGAQFVFDLGRAGDYVIGEGFSCGRRNGCSSEQGVFTSDDGEVRREIRLRGRLERQPGQGGTVRAYDIGDPKDVFLEESRFDAANVGFPTVWGMGAVAVVFGSGYLWLTRKRT